MASHAGARMVTLDPDGPDFRTSLADCRIALCLAHGIALEDIDPGLGWNISEAGYRSVRDTWTDTAATGDYFMRVPFDQVREIWRHLRPDLIHDWPEWGRAS